MTFPEDFESRLGFDQIRQRIYEKCLGELGKKRVGQIHFQTQFLEIEILLKQNQEAAMLLQRGEDLPMHHYDDPAIWFQTALLEGNFLEGDVFLKIAQALQILRNANDFLRKKEQEYPSLFQLSLPENTGKKFGSAIHSRIDDEGKVRDNASPELSGIRRRIREEESKVRRVAEQIFRKALEQGWAPEGSNPTIRDGRLVIPLTAEHKRKIKGYLIDQSATGQTVFIEPGEVMEANNDLRDLQLAERKEVVRILKELTALLRENLPELEQGYACIGNLDFIRAKA
ncbi:MAG TPA: endonuclease MutS2, partial [Cyclobacteriaceae bacterium]|nr:endonuclease MutS2 [Cyclobacteriaceae bacterium]